MRRRIDRFGNHLALGDVKWRMLRSYTLVPGTYDAPTRASTLCEALAVAVRGAMETAFAQQQSVREESGCSNLKQSESSSEISQPCVSAEMASHSPSAADSSQQDQLNRYDALSMSDLASTHDEMLPTAPQVSPHILVDLDSAGSENETGSASNKPASVAIISGDEANDVAANVITRVDRDKYKQQQRSLEVAPIEDHGEASSPTDLELLVADDYITTVPTRWMRSKIRHQTKQRPGKWHVSRSRKRRHQALCGIMRSGKQIYHARTLKARKVKQLLRLPGVNTRLRSLRARRPVYTEAAVDERFTLVEVVWPEEVRRVNECEVPNRLSFADIGEYDICSCICDCFVDSCDNVATAVYCTPHCCRLGAVCSNAPRSTTTLKLFDTERVGLGVYTTTDLDVGDIVGEYTGKLCEYEALVDGQPRQAVKMNSGYTILYNTKSTSGKYVYVEALNCGSITRFISHACDPNAAFVGMRNRSSVKVLIKMIKDVKAGDEITVHYGDEMWINCACDDCWTPGEDDEDEEGDEEGVL